MNAQIRTFAAHALTFATLATAALVAPDALASNGTKTIEPRNFSVSASRGTGLAFESDTEVWSTEMGGGDSVLHSLLSPQPFTQADVDALGDLLVDYGRQMQDADAAGWTGTLTNCAFPIQMDYVSYGGDDWLTSVNATTPAQNYVTPVSNDWVTVTINDFDLSVIFHAGCGINADLVLNAGGDEYVIEVNSAAAFWEVAVHDANIDTLGRMIELYGDLMLNSTAGAGALTPPAGGLTVDVLFTTVNGVKYITAVR